MAITGEKSDMVVASIGEGDLIVFGLAMHNQLAIVEKAHEVTVVQIVSLSKLKDKYFATRCMNGHINIWSATKQPDKLFTIVHADKDEFFDAAVLNLNSANQTSAELSKLNETQSSSKDTMIEFKWSAKSGINSYFGALLSRGLPDSTSVLCCTNYHMQKSIIATVDLKTRRKNVLKIFDHPKQPTYIFQAGDNVFIVGTVGGVIETWDREGNRAAEQVAHPDSPKGISSI